jgi:hypothetical protein
MKNLYKFLIVLSIYSCAKDDQKQTNQVRNYIVLSIDRAYDSGDSTTITNLITSQSFWSKNNTKHFYDSLTLIRTQLLRAPLPGDTWTNIPAGYETHKDSFEVNSGDLIELHLELENQWKDSIHSGGITYSIIQHPEGLRIDFGYLCIDTLVESISFHAK